MVFYIGKKAFIYKGFRRYRGYLFDDVLGAKSCLIWLKCLRIEILHPIVEQTSLNLNPPGHKFNDMANRVFYIIQRCANVAIRISFTVISVRSVKASLEMKHIGTTADGSILFGNYIALQC